MTGSSLPRRASSVRSLAYFSSAWNFSFGVLVGDALRAAHGGERLQNGLVRGAGGDQSVARGVAFEVRDAQQQMLGGNVLVLEVRGLAEGLFKSLVQRLAERRLRGRAGHTRQFLLDAVQVALQPLDGHTDLLEHGGDDALAVLDQRQQQVHGLHLRVAELGGARLRLLHRLLRLDGEFVPTNGHENSS